MLLRHRSVLVLGLLASLTAASTSTAAEKLRVLIIDGQNNHNWRAMTPPIKSALEQTGRFTVDVATTPDKSGKPEDWAKFGPEFAKYDAVISNYNGQLWPEPIRKQLEDYLANGGGLVVLHAANNAFPDWPEYNKMIGLGWRDNGFGDRITLDDAGKIVRTPKGQGPGSGHGPTHAFKIDIRKPEHPVMKGLPKHWLHAKDELYHGQRGPANDMEILASAFSATDKGGTGTNEPMVWVIPYGKGRVFTTVMGHTMGDDVTAIRCIGFLTVVARGTEWVANGKVTIPVPPDFPTEEKTSLVADKP